MPGDSLLDHVDSEYKNWSRGTRVYGALYVGIRTCLIFASALVATRDTLSSSVAPFLSRWVPILALAVTILTTVDTWMKPRDKWRGFMEDRDALDDLRLRVKSAVPQAEDGLRAEFASLRKRHREKNVY